MEIWVFTDSFSEAREVQDDIERTLYGLGMTLSGDTSRVERRRTALLCVTYAAEITAGREEIFREGVDAMAEAGYVDEKHGADHAPSMRRLCWTSTPTSLKNSGTADDPPGFRETLREVFRERGAATKGDAIADVPWLVAEASSQPRAAALQGVRPSSIRSRWIAFSTFESSARIDAGLPSRISPCSLRSR